ncbi:unnamed protein product [Trichobilharzia regenti]|nr:unnamed protein product [Trichobilharzia regenti]
MVLSGCTLGKSGIIEGTPSSELQVVNHTALFNSPITPISEIQTFSIPSDAMQYKLCLFSSCTVPLPVQSPNVDQIKSEINEKFGSSSTTVRILGTTSDYFTFEVTFPKEFVEKTRALKVIHRISPNLCNRLCIRLLNTAEAIGIRSIKPKLFIQKKLTGENPSDTGIHSKKPTSNESTEHHKSKVKTSQDSPSTIQSEENHTFPQSHISIKKLKRFSKPARKFVYNCLSPVPRKRGTVDFWLDSHWFDMNAENVNNLTSAIIPTNLLRSFKTTLDASVNSCAEEETRELQFS